MKPTLSLALAAFVATANLNAQEAAVKPADAAPAAPAAKPDMDKVSYFIGRQLGTNFKQQKIDINVETLSAAIKDTFAGKEGKYKQEELEAAMGDVQPDVPGLCDQQRPCYGESCRRSPDRCRPGQFGPDVRGS